MRHTIGDYIHYHAVNYYMYGNTVNKRRGKGDKVAYNSSDWIAQRNQVIKDMPNISADKKEYVRKAKKILQGYYNLWSKKGTEGKLSSKIYKGLEHYFLTVLKGNTEHLDEVLQNMMLNKGKVEYETTSLQKLGSDNDKRIIKSGAQFTRTLYKKIEADMKIIDDYINVTQKEPLRSDVDLKQIEEWYTQAKEDFNKLSAEVLDNNITFLNGDKIALSDLKHRSKGHELKNKEQGIYIGDKKSLDTYANLKKNLNQIVEAYNLGFNLNDIQGISFEYLISMALGRACHTSIKTIGDDLEKILKKSKKTIVGQNTSLSIMNIVGNAHVDLTALEKQFGAKDHYKAEIKSGRAKIYADIETQGKTDISITLPNNEPLNVSAKSYHTGKIGTQQNIALVTGTHWYLYLQDIQHILVNHFFNTTTTYQGTKRWYGENIAEAKKYMKLVILQKALMGTTQKEKGKKIDYLAINNRGSVDFKPMKDILREANENNFSKITIENSKMLDGKTKIQNYNLYVGNKDIQDQESAKSRITNLIAQTMSKKITVEYKYK